MHLNAQAEGMGTRTKAVRQSLFASRDRNSRIWLHGVGPGKAEDDRAAPEIVSVRFPNTASARLAGITVVWSMGGNRVPCVTRYPAVIQASDSAAALRSGSWFRCHIPGSDEPEFP